MKAFIFRLFQFALFSFLTLIIVYVSYINIKRYNLKVIPPINFSDSYSFNKKIEFSKLKKCEVLSLGSLMTLINLDSRQVIKEFNSYEYLNLSSWGLSMKDIFRLIKIYNQTNNFKTLVICSNSCDFSAKNKVFSTQDVLDYLNSKNDFFYFIKKFDLKYFISNISLANESLSGNKHYESFLMDDYGGVLLSDLNFKKREERWSNDNITPVRKKQYDYLDSINHFCLSSKINLYFFQTPIRKGLVNDVNKDFIEKHVIKCRQILSNKVNFVNSMDTIWNDNLFVDGTHFNKKGAEKFTKYCFDKIN